MLCLVPLFGVWDVAASSVGVSSVDAFSCHVDYLVWWWGGALGILVLLVG